MRRSTIPLVITLAATVGLTACEKKPASTEVDPDAIAAAQNVKVDKDFGDKVRAYILQHPEILLEAQQALQLKAMAEEDQAIEKQFGPHKVQLQRDKRDFVINPKGKITVVEMFDYNCSYCKVIAPEVAQTLVMLGLDPRNVATAADLQTAIGQVLRQPGFRAA